MILDVASLTPIEAAAFFELDELDASQLREIGLAWLEQGKDAPDLAILASECDPILSDVAPMFKRILRSLGVASPTMTDARRVAEAALLRDIVEDGRQTSGKVWQLLEMFYYRHFRPDSEGRYSPMIGLFYSAEQTSGADALVIERRMQAEASRLLSEQGQAP